ncbi:SpoIIE family protein phosphatase [Streptomyces kaempferi]|uniref:SpoIIE family protein phosphatase n=1 Tax=Streptomyces kaempferi TaxID=333725 RepID=A0ABW3XSV3_9ACTN
MIDLEEVTPGESLSAREVSCVAIALVDANGAVIGWTRAAQQLVGYSAAEAVGRPATVVLPSIPTDVSGTSVFGERYHARGDWSGRAEVRHRDGHKRHVTLRLSLLIGQEGRFLWLVSATEIAMLSSRAANGSVRESLLTRRPIGIVIRDRELRCTFVNDVMERQDGIVCDERLGHGRTKSTPDLETEALEAAMQHVIKSGIPTIHEYQAGPAARRGEQAFSVSLSCIEDAEGHALGVCCMSVDITASQRSRERLAILSEGSIRIGSTLDVMQVGQELAELAVPLLADCTIVDLAESFALGEEPSALTDLAMGHNRAFRRVGLASVSQGNPEAAWAPGEATFIPSASPFASALSCGRSYLEPVVDTSTRTWLEQDPVRARKIQENSVHSLMGVPICARRVVVGVVLFLRTKDPVPFAEDDLLLAEELVSRAALSLDNARRYAREHATALALQRDLLPHRLTGGLAVEVASRYLPASRDGGVGGDWFDVIPLSGARVALVVGDVVGHGINAAATMGRLRTAVHTLAGMDLPPDELLAHLDDMVQRMAEEETDTGSATSVMGATCLYAIYDPVNERCTMARAGHPPPAIVDPHGGVTFPDLPAGVPLGLGLGSFEAVEMDLPEGSLLAFYTDGLIESRDYDIDVGMRLLSSALAQPGLALEGLCSDVIDAMPTQTSSDDVTLLLVRTRSLSPDQTISWDLPADPAAVSSARMLAAGQLTEWGLQRLTSTTELIISELVTNAITHGVGPIHLRLIRHRELTCEVWDASDCMPRLRHARTTDEHGRGLLLVAQFSHRWGTRHTPDNKVVWAEQDLSPTP